MAKKVLLDGIIEQQYGFAQNIADIKACTTMSDNDCFLVVYNGEAIFFQYDVDSTTTATVVTHPYVLTPDSNPGRWVERPSVGGGSTVDDTITLDDDDEITLTSGKAGFGEVMIGDNQEHAMFTFTSAGVVTLTLSSAEVVNTDTDAKLCIYDGGTSVNIKNRLG